MTEQVFSPAPELQRHEQRLPQAVGAVALFEDMRLATEHSRTIESGDTYKGLRELVDIGVAIPLAGAGLIHGRYDTNRGVDWTVDPYVDNGGDATHNNNVYDRPVLYVASSEKAGLFSQARAEQAIMQGISRDIAKQLFGQLPEEKKQTYRNLSRQGLTDEEVAYRHLGFEASRVFHGMDQQAKRQQYDSMSSRLGLYSYDIGSHDTEAVLIDTTKHLTEQEKERRSAAITKMLVGVLEGSPVPFEYREVALPVARMLQQEFVQKAATNDRRFTKEDVARIAKQSGAASQLVEHLAGSFNARDLLCKNLGTTTLLYTQSKPGNTVVYTDDGTTPVNLDYIGTFFRKNHIVGTMSRVRSATIGESLTIGALFDLHAVNDTEHLAYERKLQHARYKRLVPLLQKSMAPKNPTDAGLLSRFQEPHTKPSKLVEAALGYRKGDAFYKDTGNWEKFTLGEHTESVLKNFNENYAEAMPVEIAGLMRLALIVHDIGKPAAAEQGVRQEVYNQTFAKEFMESVGVPAQTRDFVLGLIGTGAKLAERVVLRGDDVARAELVRHAKKQMLEVLGKAPTKYEVEGYAELCEALLACDGGAYTTMAVTRGKQGYYRNAGSFNKSFRRSTRPGGSDLQFVHGGITNQLWE
jgi:hypothetical protein